MPSKQAPIHSGFGPTTTAKETIDRIDLTSDLTRHMTDEELQGFGLSREDSRVSVPAGKSVVEGGDFKTLEQGAATSVRCATSPRLAGMGGVYCLDVDIAEVLESDFAIGPGVLRRAIDPKTAERLWNLSEELTGVKI